MGSLKITKILLVFRTLSKSATSVTFFFAHRDINCADERVPRCAAAQGASLRTDAAALCRHCAHRRGPGRQAAEAGGRGREEYTGRGAQRDERFFFLLYMYFIPVLGIRFRRIRMFSGLLDLDPLVRGMDPDPDPSLFSKGVE